MKGWISIHRSIKAHWLYPKGRAFTKYEAWITILLEVNHTDKKEPKGFNLIECKRGESIKSLDTWAKLFHWNKSKVRRFFIMLQNDSMIETKSVQKTTHLKVCNYDNYQNQRNDTETKVKRKRNDTETELTPNNNDNKENNVNNDNKKDIKFNFKNSLLSLGIEKQVVEDWIKVRRTKKATDTETAFNKIKKQIELCDLTANECIKIAVEKDWKGFEKSWLKNLGTNGQEPKRKKQITDINPDTQNSPNRLKF